MMQNNPINIFQQFLAMGTNPQQITQRVFQQNPQLQVLANQMQQSGLSPIDFIMQYARQQNININPNMIQNMYQQMRGMVRY